MKDYNSKYIRLIDKDGDLYNKWEIDEIKSNYMWITHESMNQYKLIRLK